jgi:hypothetical protein
VRAQQLRFHASAPVLRGVEFGSPGEVKTNLSELNTLYFAIEVGTLQTWTSARSGKFLIRPDRPYSAAILDCAGCFVNRILGQITNRSLQP